MIDNFFEWIFENHPILFSLMVLVCVTFIAWCADEFIVWFFFGI